jgi:hypothetical protein
VTGTTPSPVRAGRRRRLPRGVATLACALVVAASAAACSSDDSTGSKSSDNATTTTAGNSAPGTATIPVFDVPTTTACGGETSTKVPVKYQTAGAARQQLLVDGLEIKGTGPSEATLEVEVHCDTTPHTFVLIAYDANDQKTSQQKILTTELG